jgi:hypothetical protein
MSTTPASRSSAARMTRHRERRRQGTRCVTVDVSQSELDALVVRGYVSEEERDSGAATRLPPLSCPSRPVAFGKLASPLKARSGGWMPGFFLSWQRK